MARIFVGNVRAARFQKRIFLIPILTMVLSTFMYQGWFWPDTALAAARVGAGGTGGGSATSYNITIPATTAGNTLIAVVGAINNANIVNSITGGGTWTRAASAVNINTHVTEIWYCPNITAGVTTVTVNTSNAVNTAIIVQEYSGVVTASPLDKTATATGNGTAQNSGTTTATAQANELWVAGFSTGVTGAYSGQSAGWTIVTNYANTVQTALVENLTNSATTANCTITGPNGIWGGAVATFLPGATGNLTIADGANMGPANAQQGSTNQAIDSFTTAMSTGIGTINSLTLTTSAQFTAANVANIRLYRDTAPLGSYGAGDTPVPSTYTIGSGTATINITTPESVTAIAANYLITVDIAAGAAVNNTLAARVTGASGSFGTPTYSDAGSATLTITAGTCVRSAPTVALSPASGNVTQGGNTTYNVTLTNNDTVTFCGSSTFTLSASDSNTTDFNASSLSATIPNPCALGPAGTCTATLTVTAKATGTIGNTDTTTVTSTDTTNHNGQNGTGTATSTIVAAGGGAQAPAGNMVSWAFMTAAIGGYGILTARRRRSGAGRS